MEPIQLDPERGNLNKWEMYKLLVQMNEPTIQVPNTAPMSPQSIMTFLSRHRQIYLKPVGTWGGRGISRITRIDRNQGLPFQYQWESPGQDPKIFRQRANLLRHILALYRGEFCIVQASAPILDWEGRPFDVRLLMQKELDDRWISAGFLIRVGGSGSIVSNIGISDGEVRPINDLSTRLGMGEASTPFQHLLQILERSGHRICRALDAYRNFQEVGIDFGIDAQNNPWIIEVNTDDALGGPSHELFAQLPDPSLFEAIQGRSARHASEILNFLFNDVLGDY